MNSNSINEPWFEINPKKTIAFLFLVLIVIIEVLLRIFFPSHMVNTNTIVPSNEVFKNYRPSIKFITNPSRHDSFEPAHNVINSIGIRGPELAKKEHYRVLNIGDSFIQADEIQFEDTFGEKLNKKFTNIEFISHGISSWSPTPEFSWIYHNADKIKFNEVNLFLCVNDFYRTHVYSGTDQYYRGFANYIGDIPVNYKVQEAKNIKQILKDNVYIVKMASFIKFKIKNILKPEETTKASYIPSELIMLSKESDMWDKNLKENVNDTLAVIKNLKNYLDSKDIKLNVLMVPFGFAWSNENVYGKLSQSYGWDKDFTVSQNGIEDYLQKYLNNIDVHYIDLRNDFNKSKENNVSLLLFNEADGHWNKNGHNIVFNVLKKYYENYKITSSQSL